MPRVYWTIVLSTVLGFVGGRWSAKSNKLSTRQPSQAVGRCKAWEASAADTCPPAGLIACPHLYEIPAGLHTCEGVWLWLIQIKCISIYVVLLCYAVM